MGLVCSGCYCDEHMGGKCYVWDNLKCKLANAAQRRHAKKVCRCVRRRPKCLRIRRRSTFQCNCNHESCILGLNEPPIPAGCGPPLKPVCNMGSPTLRSGIPRPVQATQATNPQLPPCVRSPGEIPPCVTPCCRSGEKPPCGENPPCGRPPCLNTGSPVMLRTQSPPRKFVSKTVSTDAPKNLKTVSKTVNTEVLCPVGRSRSPEKKKVLCPVGKPRSAATEEVLCPVRKPRSAAMEEVLCPVRRSRTPEKKVVKNLTTRSVSSSPEPQDQEHVHVCGCEVGEQSPDRKNCCRFTVDAYFQ
ncbi:hypothetical protein O0L34_g1759 [Tuta absoluta]|nr:hypothetical protein O0L34_g1759 [Tuta absoluta]